MTENGKIIRTENTYAYVRLKKNPNCGGCRMCGFKRGMEYVDVKADNIVGATQGDEVVIETAKDNSIKAAAIVYLLPLLFAALGVLIGYFLNSEILTVALCLIMLVLGYIIIALIDKKLSKRKDFRPQIIKIIKGETKDE